MKQHITIEQLNELSDKGKVDLVEWCDKNDISVQGMRGDLEVFVQVYSNDIDFFTVPLLSIGQMIGLLNKYKREENLAIIYGAEHYFGSPHKWKIQVASNNDDIGISNISSYGFVKKEEELCDALWEATKEVLEE